MKRLQEETGAKMSILGKGSMRDKDKVWMMRSCQNWIHIHVTWRNIQRRNDWTSNMGKIRVKEDRDADRAADWIASSWQKYVGDNHICPVCCIMVYSVIVNYKCRVMTLFAFIPLTPAPRESTPLPTWACEQVSAIELPPPIITVASHSVLWTWQKTCSVTGSLLKSEPSSITRRARINAQAASAALKLRRSISVS